MSLTKQLYEQSQINELEDKFIDADYQYQLYVEKQREEQYWDYMNYYECKTSARENYKND